MGCDGWLPLGHLNSADRPGIHTMPTQVACPHCHRSLKVPESSLGKNGKCPNCQQTFVIQASIATDQGSHVSPASSDPKPIAEAPKVTTACACGAVLKVASTLRGKQVRCPKCQQVMTVPTSADKQKVAPEPFGQIPSAPTSSHTGSGNVWDDLQLPSDQPSTAFVGNQGDAFSYQLAPAEKVRKPLNAIQHDARERQSEAALAMEGSRSSFSMGDLSWFQIKWGFICLCLILGGPVVAINGYLSQRSIALIAKEGVTTEGTIMEFTESRTRRGFRSYTMDFIYSVDGKQYSKTVSVGASFFHEHVKNELIVNDSVVVTYAKSDPSQASIEDAGGVSFAGIGVGLSLLAVGAGGLVAVLFLFDDE